MDLITLFSFIAIIVLAVVLFMILTHTDKKQAKTASDKKHEIINAYKIKLHEALNPLEDDKQAVREKKTALLKNFSDELSRNIFFDYDEMKSAIQELASYDIKMVTTPRLELGTSTMSR